MTGMLENKVAIITGAGHGMGRAGARIFAGYGAKLCLADINPETVESIAAEVRSAGGEAVAVVADITKDADVERMVATAVQRYGRLDCAYNNAGGSTSLASTLDIEASVWEKILQLNLLGQWLCMKHEIAAMLKTGGGNIVNTASGAGLRGTPNLVAYGAAKAALINLTMTAAVEYADQGIRANAICPGVIDTDSPGFQKSKAAGINWAERMNIPMKRTGRPEEVAELAAWLSTSLCGFMTGQIISVDGGQTTRQ